MASYDIGEHRHRFAGWAAARATQRGLGATTRQLMEALESTDLPRRVRRRSTWPQSTRGFDRLHRRWVRSIREHLLAGGASNARFGHGAKLVGIYIKAAVILVAPDSDFARIAHPPIDRMLLQDLAKTPTLPAAIRKRCRSTSWTQLDETSYYELIATLRDLTGTGPFWTLERFWKPKD